MTPSILPRTQQGPGQNVRALVFPEKKHYNVLTQYAYFLPK